MPSLGGKVRDMTLGGRQWLWHNPDVPFAAPEKDAPFSAATDSGGFDECFPTVESCRLPRWVKGARWVKLPSHGELWKQQPQFAILTDAEGHSATCTWSGAKLPYRFTRRITLHPEGWVAFAYSATNTGKHRIPFVWSSHPVFPLTPRTRIVLPEGARVKVWSQSGVRFGKPGSAHSWPRLHNGEKLVDLSRPFSALGGDYACKLFVELPRREVLVAVEEGGDRLEMMLHGREISSVGLSIHRRESAQAPRALWPFAPKLRAGSTIAIEPCLGAPDRLSDALGTWDDAHWLEPGGTARWSMTWRSAADGGGQAANAG